MTSPATLTWTDELVTLDRTSEGSAAALFDLNVEKAWRVIRDEISAFGSYERDWDGYGSDAPDPNLVGRALTFVIMAKSRGFGAPSNAVLSPNGAIAIEWRSGDFVRQAELGETTEVRWVEFSSRGNPVHWSEFLMEDPSVRGGDWVKDQRIAEGDAGVASAL